METDAPRIARYWAKVDKRATEDCWPWMACLNRSGYGMFRPGDGEQLAHRYGYRVAYGPIPIGMVICHHCDNPPCQNPAHLFLGTTKDNSDDKIAKGRQSYPPPHSGEINPASRFTNAEVEQMRSMYETGSTQIELASLFGARQSVISKILRTRAGSQVDGSTRRARGLRNNQAKLTDAEVTEIRRAYAAKECSQDALAKRFGVSQPSVSSIILGKTRVISQD